MSACSIFLALGLFSGLCTPPPTVPRGVGESDPLVFDYDKPVPPPPPPQPKVVTMPPVVVEKKVPVEVLKPVIQERVKTQYVDRLIQPKPEPAGPTPFEIAVQSAQIERQMAQRTLEGDDIVGAGSQSVRGNAPRFNANLPNFPPPSGIDESNSKYSAPPRFSTSAVDNTRILAADRIITGILENGVNSQLADAGKVVVQVSRDVYGAHGRTKLVPKGSRLICRYESVDKVGQTRVAFECGRVLLAESRSEIYQLKAKVGDVQGYAGVSGEVNNRFWEKYGTAFMTVGIGSAVEAAVLGAQQVDQSDSNIIGNGMSGVSENFGKISASILEDTVDLTPIIRIAQGTRVQIRPEFDWYLADPPRN